jgi:hypothetical protein
MNISTLLIIATLLAGCASQADTTATLPAKSSPTAEFLNRLRAAQSQQSKTWEELLGLGREYGWSAEDMVALTQLRQNAHQGSEVYSVDQLDEFTASTCTPSALSAADRIERLLFTMEQDFEKKPGNLSEEQRSKAVQETQSNAAYLVGLRPMCERMQAEQPANSVSSPSVIIQSPPVVTQQTPQEPSLADRLLEGAAIGTSGGATAQGPPPPPPWRPQVPQTIQLQPIPDYEYRP